MRVVKALVAWSGSGSGTKIFHSQRIGAESPRVLSVTVDRGFCPPSMYGRTTYPHKYTLRLANSDGALDQYRTLWSRDQSVFSVYAADDASFAGTTWATDTGSTDLKFARHITRVIVTASEVILEADGGSIREFLDVRLAQLYTTIYNTFSQNQPQLWAAGRVTVDVDALQIVGADTDFDTGTRAAELVQTFSDGALITPAAAVGAGDFSLVTATYDKKRIVCKLSQPTAAAPCNAGAAFDDIMSGAGFVAGTTYVQNWVRGSLDQTAKIGASAREETRLQTIEKIIGSFDAGLAERSDGKIAVVCLQDFYGYTTATAGYALTQNKILSIEIETAPFDGLGKRIAWNQNDAIHSAGDATFVDTYSLNAPAISAEMPDTYNGIYENDAGVKDATFNTWFYQAGGVGTGPVIACADHLVEFYSNENFLLNVTAPGFDLQELNPGDKVDVTHERFDLGATPNKMQLLNLRYDVMQLTTSMQLIGKKR